MTGLPYEQVTGLVNLVEDYLEGWQPACGRHHEMELFDGVLATLFYYRHNCSQHVVGAVFGVSQPTISRVITTLEEPIAAVLDREVPELVKVIISRVVIPDGTLIPTRNRARHPELYSGKRHRSGAAVQVLSSTEGRLCHVGEPLVGATHDITAFRETALAAVLEEHLHDNLVIADLGYCGHRTRAPCSDFSSAASRLVDLTELTYLDSAGIRILFTLASLLVPLRIMMKLIVPLDSPIRRLIELSGLESLAYLRPENH